MPQLKRYHEILRSLHIGCEDPAAYFIAFNKTQNAAGDRSESERLTSLCSEWNFKFFENVARVQIESEGFPQSVECGEKIDVPGCWQLQLCRGYDSPNYINQDYPYPVDPPYLPDVIPCGLYYRTLDFTSKEGRSYYLNFEGVSSCFYLWVNGEFAAYSQVSHCSSVVDITQYLVSGSNSFHVLVVKHCDGSYLEDQDFFRLSGIFREVYITERDEVHISDIGISTEVSDDFSRAVLNADISITGKAEVLWRLLSPEGEELSRGKAENNTITTAINAPKLWNYEVPVLYTLLITCGEELISFPVGIKRLEIVNSCVLLNGKGVKAKGINRHDSSPETGYCVTCEQMLEELYILKRANVNTIRTSHYPNDPRFLEMCDRLGFMIVDEADLETHGMGYNYSDWYWDYWSYLSDAPQWQEAYLDRARRLYERDKNHVCVIMWSLGNESGCGENHRAMAQYIHSRNAGAIVHYENARLEYAERLNKDFSDISDVESRMYASIDYLKSYLADESLKKPFFYCEYVCSMSTGEIYKHWDEFEDNGKYFGGCIWEFCDHAVNVGTRENPKYRYGGDFGDWPHDGINCIDGLVHPDRTPRPGYYDMKKAYEPFEAKLSGCVLTLRSKRLFTDFSDLSLEWTVEENGKVIMSESIDNLDISPRAQREFRLFDTVEFKPFSTLNVYIKLAEDTPWAKKGYEIGFAQFVLNGDKPAAPEGERHELTVDESRTDITVKSAGIEYRFDRVKGVLGQITLDGREMLSEPASFAMWRPCTYNTRDFLHMWERARYNKVMQKTYKTSVETADGGAAIIAEVSFAAAAMPPAVRARVEYAFSPDGSLTITTNTRVTENAPDLPRFGLSLVMPGSFAATEYFGYGPKESYSDRFRSQRLSLHKTTVSEDYEHYVKPQESCSHYMTSYASISDGESALEFYACKPESFCFKAIEYSDMQLHETAHDDELTPTGKSFVSLDYKINASNPGDEGINPERIFSEKDFTFGIKLVPKRL